MLFGKRKDGQAYPKTGKGHGLSSTDFSDREFDGHSEIINGVRHTFVNIPDIRDKEYDFEKQSDDRVTVKEFMDADPSYRVELMNYGLEPLSIIIADNSNAQVKLGKLHNRVIFNRIDGSMLNPDIELIE